MSFQRPVVKVDTSHSLSDSVDLLLPMLAPEAEPVLLCCLPERTEWRLNRQLDSWKCADAEFEQIQRAARNLAREISRLGFPTTIEQQAESSAAALLAAVDEFDADLVVTPRAVRCRRSMTYFSCPDEDLIAQSAVPVWLAGSPLTSGAPVVVALDPANASEEIAAELSGLIETGLALTQANDAARKIVFVAVDEASENASRDATVFDYLRMAIFERWLKHSGRLKIDAFNGVRFGAAGPIRVRFAGGDAQTLEHIIRQMEPACIVAGRPNRTEFDRCFHPGMLRAMLEASTCHFFQPETLSVAKRCPGPSISECN